MTVLVDGSGGPLPPPRVQPTGPGLPNVGLSLQMNPCRYILFLAAVLLLAVRADQELPKNIPGNLSVGPAARQNVLPQDPQDGHQVIVPISFAPTPGSWQSVARRSLTHTAMLAPIFALSNYYGILGNSVEFLPGLLKIFIIVLFADLVKFIIASTIFERITLHIRR